MALCGIPVNRASFSSWAKLMPPRLLISPKPNEPSEPVPDRITPMARSPWLWAKERKKWSMGSGGNWPLGRGSSFSAGPSIVIWNFGGTT